MRSPACPSHKQASAGGGERKTSASAPGNNFGVTSLFVPSVNDDLALGIRPDRQAGNAEHSRLLLHVTRVGDDSGCSDDGGMAVGIAPRLTSGGCISISRRKRLDSRS